MLNLATPSSLFEFDTNADLESWRIVNDGVMGGLSDSQVKWNEENGTLEFSGNVSLENNGGFASTRTAPQQFKHSDFKTIHLRVKGDGQTYKFRMRSSDNFDGISYSKNFKTKKDEWVEIEMPVADFEATFRGRIFPKHPQLKTEDLRQIGFLIADKQKGKFHLEVDWIRVE